MAETEDSINKENELPDITFEDSFMMVRKVTTGHMSPIKSSCIKDMEENIRRLQQENFDLRLHCYHLEQNQKDGSTVESDQSNQGYTLALEKQAERMRKDNDEKCYLLKCANKAIDHLRAEKEVVENNVAQLTEQVQHLTLELNKRKEIVPLSSVTVQTEPEINSTIEIITPSPIKQTSPKSFINLITPASHNAAVQTNASNFIPSDGFVSSDEYECESQMQLVDQTNQSNVQDETLQYYQTRIAELEKKLSGSNNTPPPLIDPKDSTLNVSGDVASKSQQLKISELLAELNKLRLNYQKAGKAIAGFIQKLSKKDATITQLEAQLQGKNQEKHTEIQVVVENHRQEWLKRQHEVVSLHATISDLKKRVSSEEARCEKLNQRISSLTEDIRETQQVDQTRAIQLEVLEGQLAALCRHVNPSTSPTFLLPMPVRGKESRKPTPKPWAENEVEVINDELEDEEEDVSELPPSRTVKEITDMYISRCGLLIDNLTKILKLTDEPFDDTHNKTEITSEEIKDKADEPDDITNAKKESSITTKNTLQISSMSCVNISSKFTNGTSEKVQTDWDFAFVKELLESRDALTADLDEYKRQNEWNLASLEALNERCAGLEKQIEKYQAHRQPAAKELIAKCEKFKSQIHALENELISKDSEIDELQNSLRDVSSSDHGDKVNRINQIFELNNIVSQLQSDIRQKCDEIKHLKLNHSDEIQRLNSRLTSISADNETKRYELERVAQEASHQSQKLKEDFEEEKCNLLSEMHKLQDQLDNDFMASQEKIDTLTGQLADECESGDQLRHCVDQIYAHLTEAKVELYQTQRHMGEQREELEERENHLHDQVREKENMIQGLLERLNCALKPVAKSSWSLQATNVSRESYLPTPQPHLTTRSNATSPIVAHDNSLTLADLSVPTPTPTFKAHFNNTKSPEEEEFSTTEDDASMMDHLGILKTRVRDLESENGRLRVIVGEMQAARRSDDDYIHDGNDKSIQIDDLIQRCTPENKAAVQRLYEQLCFLTGSSSLSLNHNNDHHLHQNTLGDLETVYGQLKENEKVIIDQLQMEIKTLKAQVERGSEESLAMVALKHRADDLQNRNLRLTAQVEGLKAEQLRLPSSQQYADPATPLLTTSLPNPMYHKAEEMSYMSDGHVTESLLSSITNQWSMDQMRNFQTVISNLVQQLNNVQCLQTKFETTLDRSLSQFMDFSLVGSTSHLAMGDSSLHQGRPAPTPGMSATTPARRGDMDAVNTSLHQVPRTRSQVHFKLPNSEGGESGIIDGSQVDQNASWNMSRWSIPPTPYRGNNTSQQLGNVTLVEADNIQAFEELRERIEAVRDAIRCCTAAGYEVCEQLNNNMLDPPTSRQKTSTMCRELPEDDDTDDDEHNGILEEEEVAGSSNNASKPVLNQAKHVVASSFVVHNNSLATSSEMRPTKLASKSSPSKPPINQSPNKRRTIQVDLSPVMTKIAEARQGREDARRDLDAVVQENATLKNQLYMLRGEKHPEVNEDRTKKIEMKYQEELKQMNQKLHDKTQEIQHLQICLSDLQDQCVNLQQKVFQNRNTTSRVNRSSLIATTEVVPVSGMCLEEWKAKVDELETEKGRLTDHLDSVRIKYVAARTELERENNSLQQELGRLSAELDSISQQLEKRDEDLRRVGAEYDEVMGDKLSMAEELARAIDARDAIERDFLISKQQNEELHNELNRIRNEMKCTQTKKVNFEAMENELCRDVKDLRHRLHSTEKELEERQENVNHLSSENRLLRNAMGEREEEITRLKDEVHLLTTNKEKLSSEVFMIQHETHNQQQNLQQIRAQLNSAKEELSETKDELKTKSRKLSEAESRADELSHDLKMANQKLDSKTRELIESNKTLEIKMNCIAEANRHLEISVREMSMIREEAIITQHKLEEKYREAGNKISDLETSMSVKVRELEVMKTKVQDFEGVRSQMEDLGSQLNREIAEKESLTTQLKGAEQEVKNTEGQLEMARKEKITAEKKYKQEWEEVRQTGAENRKKLMATLATKSQETETVYNEMTALSHELQAVQNANTRLELDLEEEKSNTLRLEAQVAQLELDLSAQRKRSETGVAADGLMRDAELLQNRVSSLVAQQESQRAYCTELRQKITSRTSRLEQCLKENARLKAVIESDKKRVQETIEELTRLESEIRSRDQRILVLEQSLHNATLQRDGVSKADGLDISAVELMRREAPGRSSFDDMSLVHRNQAGDNCNNCKDVISLVDQIVDVQLRSRDQLNESLRTELSVLQFTQSHNNSMSASLTNQNQTDGPNPTLFKGDNDYINEVLTDYIKDIRALRTCLENRMAENDLLRDTLLNQLKARSNNFPHEDIVAIYRNIIDDRTNEHSKLITSTEKQVQEISCQLSLAKTRIASLEQELREARTALCQKEELIFERNRDIFKLTGEIEEKRRSVSCLANELESTKDLLKTLKLENSLLRDHQNQLDTLLETELEHTGNRDTGKSAVALERVIRETQGLRVQLEKTILSSSRMHHQLEAEVNKVTAVNRPDSSRSVHFGSSMPKSPHFSPSRPSSRNSSSSAHIQRRSQSNTTLKPSQISTPNTQVSPFKLSSDSNKKVTPLKKAVISAPFSTTNNQLSTSTPYKILETLPSYSITPLNTTNASSIYRVTSLDTLSRYSMSAGAVHDASAHHLLTNSINHSNASMRRRVYRTGGGFMSVRSTNNSGVSAEELLECYWSDGEAKSCYSSSPKLYIGDETGKDGARSRKLNKFKTILHAIATAETFDSMKIQMKETGQLINTLEAKFQSEEVEKLQNLGSFVSLVASLSTSITAQTDILARFWLSDLASPACQETGAYVRQLENRLTQMDSKLKRNKARFRALKESLLEQEVKMENALVNKLSSTEQVLTAARSNLERLNNESRKELNNHEEEPTSPRHSQHSTAHQSSIGSKI